MPVIKPDPTLPDGWQCLYEASSDSTYYWNKATGKTQFERPAGPPAGGAAAPPLPVSSLSLCLLKQAVKLTHVVCKLPGPLLQAANGHANGYASNGVGRSSSFAMSAQEYRQQHGLLVQGRDVPDPFQTFESAGFGRDILAEV